MLKNEAIVNRMLSRWYSMLDENLMVFLCVHNSLSFDLKPLAEMEPHTKTEPTLYFTDGCQQSLLYLSTDLLEQKKKCNFLDLLLHKTHFHLKLWFCVYIFNAAVQTDHIILLDGSWAVLFFRTKLDFSDPNKQISPIRPFHLSTSLITSQTIHLHNEM